jgi:hypothetical protein
VTAIVPLLKEKVASWLPGRQVTIVPNGVSPESFDLSVARKELPRGEVTVGYFGYLAQAWFDWQLVADTARAKPSWVFHIIGYGEEPAAELPDNVHLLGKVPHHLLFAFSQNWDVGIVPFKPTTLSKGADPIKVYEYLTLGLPVVAADIPHLREYPGVFVASSAEEFLTHLETAAGQPFPEIEVDAFLEKATWLQRGLSLLEVPHDLAAGAALVGGGEGEERS